MTTRRQAGLAAALVSSVIVGSALPAATAGAEVVTLHVNNDPAAHCSDAGQGTEAQPYCTVQAAADAAQPGQTVLIARGTGTYAEQVTVTRSGSVGNPITFRGVPGADKRPVVRIGSGQGGGAHGFVLSKVHDITVQGLAFATPEEAVLVSGTDRIVVDGNVVTGAEGSSAPGIRVTGEASATTVSRNRVGGSGGAGIAVDGYSSGTVVTTNAVNANRGGGIVVTDAAGTVVTSNSAAENCRSGITLAGNSSGAVVENNIVTATGLKALNCAQVGGTELVVSQLSAAETKADYNTVHPEPGGGSYLWAGAVYTSPAGFAAGTGQGAHDSAANPRLALTGSAADELDPRMDDTGLDSADAGAPGELGTDLLGNGPVDDPLVSDTGAGAVAYRDRGAIEYQDPMRVNLIQLPDYAYDHKGRPLDLAFDSGALSPWSPETRTISFGDGTGPQVVNGVMTHTFPGPGTYRVEVTAVNGLGTTRTVAVDATVHPVPGMSDPWLSLGYKDGDPELVYKVQGGVTSPWPVARVTLDYGDGTPALTTDLASLNTGFTHRYPSTGHYTVRAVYTDDHGRSISSANAYQFYGSGPELISGTPVTGHWTGGRTSYVGLFREGQWSLSTGSTTGRPAVTAAFGQYGDVPIAGDWDGVNHDQLGIYRPSTGTFALRHDDGGATAVAFGDPGDLPVPGPWDGNGHAQLAVYRPSTGTFAVRHDDGSVTTARFGDPGDQPLIGDWDGVGHLQLGIYRSGISTFALRHDDGSVSAAAYGAPGDLPVTGDWLGQGRTTFGVYRPSQAVFSLANAYGRTGDYVFSISRY
ncbi:right-handed parallel beta-helix repeat-containing protein [Kitasatospora sp. NPDC127111]|uniref:right-handed parallel beta-helix repeat-containing protein n=1 Tax=Kitasatospora sp. NPDC127111 TaxID=3345363 RepID=UPI003635501E